MVITVRTWTGQEVRALRGARRMSVRGFAGYLGVNERVVSNWEARGRSITPRPVNQQALDTCLNEASDDERSRFASLIQDEFVARSPSGEGTAIPACPLPAAPAPDALVLMPAEPTVTVSRPDRVTVLVATEHEVLSVAAARARAFVVEMSTSNVSGESMDQLHDDVAALAAAYQRQPPSSIIGDLVSTQETIFSLLEGRQQVTNTRRLLLLAGITSGLLAKISQDLADPHTALAQSRTAYLCADNADHNGMRAWTRGLQSLITYWAGRYHDSVQYAQHGSQFAARGTSGVWLSMCEARAWAALGNDAETMAAIRRAEANRETTEPDELDELGGLCTFSVIRQTYYAADALAWLPSLAPTAEDYAQRAVTAHMDPTVLHWAYGAAAGSATDLAIARLRRGEVDGAAEALEPVLALPPGQRINGIVTSVNHVYAALTAVPAAAAVHALQERIEDFTTTPLRALGA